MVGRDNDERGAREAGEPIEQRAEGAVDRSDLAIVRLGGVPRSEVGWRLVRRVGIEDVHPREKLRGLPADPVDRAPGDHVRGSLGHRERDVAFQFRDLIVIDVEAGRQPEAFREREPADERAGRKTQRLQSCRERLGAILDAIAAVVAHSVLVRKLPGEDRRVGGQRDDRMRMGKREARAPGGQPIEVRRGGAAAVRSEGVGAQSVDCDEQDVLVRGLVDDVRRVARPPEGGGGYEHRPATSHQPTFPDATRCRRNRGPSGSRSARRPFDSAQARLTFGRRAHGCADPAIATSERTCSRARAGRPAG